MDTFLAALPELIAPAFLNFNETERTIFSLFISLLSPSLNSKGRCYSTTDKMKSGVEKNSEKDSQMNHLKKF